VQAPALGNTPNRYRTTLTRVLTLRPPWVSFTT
jgi:hypothetical protein